MNAEGLRQRSEGLQAASHRRDTGHCSLMKWSRLPREEKSAGEARKGNRPNEYKRKQEEGKGSSETFKPDQEGSSNTVNRS